MNKTINHLRTYRKHTDITQHDMAILLNLKGNTLVSRCEKGFKQPSLEMVVIYHLLFDIPLQELIVNNIELFKEHLLQRIPVLIKSIEQTEDAKNGESRIEFLTDTMTRLNKEVA